MTESPTPAAGILLVDKPAGWTSHDVVAFIRGFGFRKVGHCGTLDPGATGLLIIVIGRATKLSSRFAGQDKVYTGVMHLGVETFSQDADGEVTARHNCSSVTEDRILETCARFVGEQAQTPPMVSAIKVRGQALYKRARRGEIVDRPPRRITVHSLHVDGVDLPRVAFTVACSKGTYVRTLCADIGRDLGCGAHLCALRRQASGNFAVRDAYDMQQIRSWDRDAVIAHMLAPEEIRRQP